MRKILFAVLAMLCAATLARAQATIAVSSVHIQGLNGGLLVSGSLCLQATDANDANIGIQVSGGGIIVSTPFCTSVTNGAITTFNVPNPSTGSPLNFRYRIYITQGSRIISKFPNSYLCNQSGACTTPWTFNFDNCLSSGACIANPIPIVTGPVGPQGPAGMGSGSASGSGCNSAYFSTTNTVTGGTVRLDMAGCAGSDLGAIMANCQTALPAAGTCDGTNLSLSQTLSTAFTSSKPVNFIFCGQSISQTAAVILANANSSIDGCPSRSTTVTKAGNIDQFTLSGNYGHISGLNIVGVGGSFTGKGIVLSANAVAESNVVSGEAGTGIDGNIGIVRNNIVSSTSTGHPIATNGGVVASNTVTSTASDAIYVQGNYSKIYDNLVSLNPGASTSGLCAINFNDNQIGDRTRHNRITINDSTNSGNIDNGICDTPTTGHNLGMLFEGDHVNGVFSGSETCYAFVVNNAGAVTTNWSVTFRDEGAVHCGAPVGAGSPLRDLDANNMAVVWDDIQTEDANGYFDGTTTGNNNVMVIPTAISSSFFPNSVAGNGSVFPCSNCSGGQALLSGTGTLVTKATGKLIGVPIPVWAEIQSVTHAASSSGTTAVLTARNNPGDSIIVGIQCTATGAPTIAVSDTTNGTYTQDFAPTSDGANHYVSLYRFSNITGALASANTVTVSSSVNACSYVNIVSATEYSGVGGPDGSGTSATGTGTAAASGSYNLTPGDLAIGLISNFVGQINPGTGCGGGWTCRPGSGDFSTVMEDEVGGLAGTANATATALVSDPWVAIGFAYKLLQ